MPQLSGQPILILKEGATRTRGREAQRANIMAARIVSEALKTSLGPRGMDKMLVDSIGEVTVTNDGATVLKEISVEHPAARMMVEVAKTQDQEVGDGTTTAVVIAGELLTRAQALMEKGIHPTTLVEGFSVACEKARSYLDEISVRVKPTDKGMLRKIAEIAMATKTLAGEKDMLAEIASEAVLAVADKKGEKYMVDIEDVKIEKKAGGSLSDTKLVKGIVVDKEIVHARMPKRVEKAKIAMIIKPFEIEKPEFDSKLSIENPEQLEAFINREEKLLEEMVEKLAGTGANVLFCQRGIDDAAQYYMAKRGILATRRVKVADMERLAKATGGKVVTEVTHLQESDLGYADVVEEVKVGKDRMLFVEGCKNPRSVTIMVRGGNERMVYEAERAIHDAICVVRDVVQEPRIVAGGGAPEAEVARRLRDYARKTPGRLQLPILAFAEALESIPMILAENAGLDPIDILVEMRARHDKGEIWSGVDPVKGKVVDMYKIGVYEPLSVKRQALLSAAEAANMILRIDDLIAVGKSKSETPSKGSEEGAGEEES
ncbi:TCP-1/cpn60 chaperonin family protein [Candidatus Bathyarchaeota archaeon]|nr:TCP-1/cpn60 chaperonin family protein [Candidatus Bathyarchaeota archaeon]